MNVSNLSLIYSCQEIGDIEVTSTPPGAKIFIDDSDTDLITPVVIPFPPGNYTVKLTSTGFQDFIQPITIKDSQTIKVDAKLIPMTGCTFFDSDPQGAEIFIGQNINSLIDYHANTPNVICGLTPGTYVYKFIKNGFNDIIGAFTLNTDKGFTIYKNLTPKKTQSISNNEVLPLALLIGGFAIVFLLYNRNKSIT